MQRRSPGGGLDRREFLKGGTAAFVVAGVSPWLIAGSDGATHAAFTRAEFEGLVGAWFQVGGPTGEPLQLLAVQDGPASARLEQYTLLFRTGPGGALAEGIYAVSPPAGTELAMFLQPAGNEGSELRVRASFADFRPLTPAGCAAPA